MGIRILKIKIVCLWLRLSTKNMELRIRKSTIIVCGRSSLRIRGRKYSKPGLFWSWLGSLEYLAFSPRRQFGPGRSCLKCCCLPRMLGLRGECEADRRTYRQQHTSRHCVSFTGFKEIWKKQQQRKSYQIIYREDGVL